MEMGPALPAEMYESANIVRDMPSGSALHTATGAGQYQKYTSESFHWFEDAHNPQKSQNPKKKSQQMGIILSCQMYFPHDEILHWKIGCVKKISPIVSGNWDKEKNAGAY